MAQCPQRRKAVILGSGFLHDVPLKELSASFREVILVDILHPFFTRWSCRKYGNVGFLTTDVSGTAEGVWQAVENRAPLPQARTELFLDDEEVDLVVSLNLLSQLPCMPEQYLKSAGTHPPADIAGYCQAVVKAHLDYLQRLPVTVALIADVEMLTVSTSGALVGQTGTLYGVDFPFTGEQWVWPLVPRKATYPYHGVHLVVVGIANLKQALLHRDDEKQ
jgi:hypothetical protein